MLWSECATGKGKSPAFFSRGRTGAWSVRFQSRRVVCVHPLSQLGGEAKAGPDLTGLTWTSWDFTLSDNVGNTAAGILYTDPLGAGGLAQVVGVTGRYDGSPITGLVSAGGCCFTPPNDNLIGYSGPSSAAASNLGSNAVLDLSGIAFGIADGIGSGNNEVNIYRAPLNIPFSSVSDE